MAVDRRYSTVIFICDECLDELDTDEKDFQLALRVLDNEGWTAVREDGEWKHVCDTCAGDEIEITKGK